MMATVVYFALMGVFGLVGWRVLQLLIAGFGGRRPLVSRHSSTGPIGAVAFRILMILWLGLFAICVLAALTMSYGYWTGRWAALPSATG